MKFCLIDFETASQCDLKSSGAWRYAEDPTTEILCLGYTIDGLGVIILGENALRFRPDAAVDMRAGSLEAAASDPSVFFIAHNAAFEKAIWRNLMVPLLGWPDIPNDRWHDSQATCAMKSLPLKLERASAALRLSVQKDTDGLKATLALGRTNKKGYYDRTPEKLRRVYDYNRSDVLGELELHRRVRGLGADERKVWLLDQTINERGVRLDLDYVQAAQRICDDAAKPLLAEFQRLTGIQKVMSPTFKAWLVKEGCPFPRDAEGVLDTGLDKEHVAKLLGVKSDESEEDSLADDDEDYRTEEPQFVLPYSYRRPLEIRRVLGSASIKKLAAMSKCVGHDGRARGLLQYHGAGPGRWSGRLLQPQNFPRPSLRISKGFAKDGSEIFEGHDTDQLVEAILTGDAEYVRCLFGEPIEAVASGLRHALIAADGCTLEVGDFSTIEARIVLAIAGAANALSIISDKDRDVYIEMASYIFGMPGAIGKDAIKAWKAAHPEKRQTGKNTVLGCGFQMGPPKFQLRYAPNEPIEFAQKAVSAYREDFAPEVPELWWALGQAAIKTVWDRVPHEAYGIVYRLEDGFLTAQLHSGRKLWYYNPLPVRAPMPWDKDDIRPGFEYSAWKMGQWKRVRGYGGLLTENVVQATARDLLVNAMFNAEKDGHPVVLSVHDEEINEVPEAIADAKLIEQYMTDIPAWAKQLKIPVAAECWVGTRYRK